jgi:myo-inositol-1(or 4)-monophosphatase
MAEAYWEYRLKPWDMAAGVLIVEEAGGSVTTMDGRAFSG